MIRKGLYVIMCMLAMSAFSSCDHKELCYQHPHTATIRLEFDWRDAPDASPKGMCVYFYPEDGEEDVPMRRFDFTGKTGGEIEIRVGRYRVLCYNNDIEAVLMRGTEGFGTHEVFTRDGDLFECIYGSSAGKTAPRAESAENERVVISPDMLWGCTAMEVEITENGISYICIPEGEKEAWLGMPVYSEQVITLYPHELICTYTYEIRHVKGLEHVSQMCGSLSGMAPSLLFCDESLGRECVTIPFEARAGDETTVVGGFLTFGHHEENPDPHRMLLYVWMDDGSKYCYGTESERFNVTDQVHSAPDRRHVHIIIDGLDLPQPISGDNIDPSVDDWQEMNEDIHL